MRGNSSIKPIGEPQGSMWDMKEVKSEYQTQIIRGTQNSNLTVRVAL